MARRYRVCGVTSFPGRVPESLNGRGTGLKVTESRRRMELSHHPAKTRRNGPFNDSGTRPSLGVGSLFAIGRGSKPALFGAEFAPICALMGKRAEKPGENRQKSDGKWRKNGAFSRAKAPFSPCPGPTALDRNPAVCQTLRPWSPAAIEPAPAPGIGSGAPFFTAVGTDRPVRAMTAGRTVGFSRVRRWRFRHPLP